MPSSSVGHNRWTVLYYGGGTNNLEPSIRHAWSQLLDQKTPENVDTFVHHFDADGHRQEAHFEGGGAQQLLPRSETPLNSGAGETFKEFLIRGMERFPSEHYVVVVSSHGSGADGVVTDDLAQDSLSLQEVKQAMESAKKANDGRPMDVVMFDACQMGSAEMALSLQDTAETMVASIDNVGNSGYHLPTLLTQASEASDAKELAQSVVANEDAQQIEAFRNLSAIDLEGMKPFGSALQVWSDEIRQLDDTELETFRGLLVDVRRNSNPPETKRVYDSIAEDLLSQYPIDVELLNAWLAGTRNGPGLALAPFLENLLEADGLESKGLKQASRELLTAHNSLLQAQRTDTDGVAGLTLHFPTENRPGPLYGPLSEPVNTAWEAAYNALVPDGEKLPRQVTWLEEELGPMLPRQARA
jgi:hypothetical protein